MRIEYLSNPRRAKVVFEHEDAPSLPKKICIEIEERFRKKPESMPEFRIGDTRVSAQEILILLADEATALKGTWENPVVIVFDMSRRAHTVVISELKETQTIDKAISQRPTVH